MATVYDNKYIFVKDLGSGGFGKVFLARENVSDRLVAIKQLNSKEKEQQNIIVREIKVVSRFDHKSIVTYHHHFWQDEILFLVMDYCAGGSLRNILENKKTDSVTVLIWIKTLAETLQFVHERKIIHHDIKPDNILFNEEGQIKISDFGIANTGAGTRAYMSPEALNWDRKSVTDPRVDIYALGVTLMELLTGINPFFTKSKEEILAQHDKCDFPINKLPNWQQEIILKALNKVPELRFQTMNEFFEAISSKQIPVIIKKDTIQAGRIAEKAEFLIKNKKWMKAISLLDYSQENLPVNVNVLRVAGKYYLLQQQINKARDYYEKALLLNPRLDIQKDLGWINLELRNYPTAISLLSDHLHRNPSDMEAYNLLLQCYYETGRYEAGMDVAKTILSLDKTDHCFNNNYYICLLLQNNGEKILPDEVVETEDNDFIKYNYSVITESQSSFSKKGSPLLKSKLLFMDYRFRKMTSSILYFQETNTSNSKASQSQKRIIKIGRSGYNANDIEVKGNNISRRHCLIVNNKDDAWLYDLDSTGTLLNGENVISKASLIGVNQIKIDKVEYQISTDKSKLL